MPTGWPDGRGYPVDPPLPIGRGRALAGNWNRWLDAVFGGWELSGYLLLQSGMPLHVTQSGGNIWNGTQRPDLIGDPSTSGPIVDRLNRYFNEAAFSKPPIDVRGTAPRTLHYRSPSVQSLDADALKLRSLARKIAFIDGVADDLDPRVRPAAAGGRPGDRARVVRAGHGRAPTARAIILVIARRRRFCSIR